MTSRGAEKMKNDTIGVDVSKDHLDAHRLADGASTAVRQRQARPRGAHQMARGDARQTGSCSSRPALIIGAFERALGRRLAFPFVKVNPRQARRFAEAIGKSGEDRPPGCGDAGAHGRNAGAGGAASLGARPCSNSRSFTSPARPW